MQSALLAFIKATQDAATSGDNPLRHRIDLRAGVDAYPLLWFGAGYFLADRVLVWADKDNFSEMSAEEAADLFVKSLG